MIGQERYAFFTPKADSICRNTLEYIRIKQTLTLQLYEVDQDMQQIGHTIEVMNQHLEQTQNEKSIIESELEAVNRHIDSLIPKRPDGPRPKENIIDFLSERTTFTGSYGLNINQLALTNWAAGGENSWTGKAFADFKFIYRNKSIE